MGKLQHLGEDEYHRFAADAPRMCSVLPRYDLASGSALRHRGSRVTSVALSSAPLLLPSMQRSRPSAWRPMQHSLTGDRCQQQSRGAGFTALRKGGARAVPHGG